MISSRFINPWGLVTPRAGSVHGGGNDPLFHVLTMQRAGQQCRNGWAVKPYTLMRKIQIHEALIKSMALAAPRYQIKPGLFVRRPPPDTLHQETWDNVFAWIATGSKVIARRILWHGFTHFGFFNTDGKLKREDWLWRYPLIWAIAVPTAFPVLTPIYRPYIRFLQSFMKADHPGGYLLDWLWFQRAEALGVKDPDHEKREQQFIWGIEDQMATDHSIGEL